MAECRVGFQCGNQLRFTGDRVKMIQSALGSGLESAGIKTGNLSAHRAPEQLLCPVVDVIENKRNVFDRQRGAQQKDLDDLVESHAVLAAFGQEQFIFGGGQGNMPVGIVQNFQLILFAVHDQKWNLRLEPEQRGNVCPVQECAPERLKESVGVVVRDQQAAGAGQLGAEVQGFHLVQQTLSLFLQGGRIGIAGGFELCGQVGMDQSVQLFVVLPRPGSGLCALLLHDPSQNG